IERDAALRAQLARDVQPVPRRWIDAGAMVAAVHLEPYMQTRPRDRARRFEIVQHDTQRHTALDDALHMRHVGPIQWKCPGEVGESPIGECLGLEQRRDGHAVCTMRHLPASQLETLVRLDVRPQRHTESFGAAGHMLEVALHHVLMEQQRGGFDVDHAGLRTNTRALLPMGRFRNSAYCTGLMEYVSQTSSTSPACRAA